MKRKFAPQSADPTLREVRHVFLDVGGTLVYSDPTSTDIFHRVLTDAGHRIDRPAIVRLLRSPESIVTLIRSFPAGREHEFFRSLNARMIEHLGFAPDDCMLDSIEDAFAKRVAWKTYPEALPILKDLRDAGYRLGVISNASHSLPGTLRKIGLAPFFETITYSFAVGAEKPDVRIFRRAVAEAKTTEGLALHVGDSFEADYIGATRAGLHAVLLQREGEPNAPCPFIRSLQALPPLLGVAHSQP